MDHGEDDDDPASKSLYQDIVTNWSQQVSGEHGIILDMESASPALLRLQVYEQRLERSIIRWMRELRLLRTPIKGGTELRDPGPYVPRDERTAEQFLGRFKHEDRLRDDLERPRSFAEATSEVTKSKIADNEPTARGHSTTKSDSNGHSPPRGVDSSA
jgi:hypothetical protein